MLEIVDEDLIKVYEEKYKKELTEGANGSDSEEYKNAKTEYAKRTYGANARVDGNKILDEKGEVIREFEDEEAFIAEMAAAKATLEAAESMKQVPEIMKKTLSVIPGEFQKAVEKAFSGENLNQEQLDQFIKGLGAVTAGEAEGDVDYENVDKAWNSLTNSQKTVYGWSATSSAEEIEAAKEAFEATYTEIIDKHQKQFEKAYEIANKLNLDGFSSKMSGAAA
jgi:hypothetical protein